MVHQFSDDYLLDEEDLPPLSFPVLGSNVLDAAESALHQSKGYVIHVASLTLKMSA